MKLTNLDLTGFDILVKPLAGGRNFMVIRGAVGIQLALYNTDEDKLWITYLQTDRTSGAILIHNDKDNIEVVLNGHHYVNGNYIYGLRRVVYDTEGYTLSDARLVSDGTNGEQAANMSQIIATSDGGYILLGAQTISGNHDILVKKIDSAGNMATSSVGVPIP